MNKLPRNYKYALGDRVQTQFYTVLEGLIRARYAAEKLEELEALNVELELVAAPAVAGDSERPQERT